jgi:2,3-bisphosphoglycerate-independent phosphoglycerate mutase
MSRRPVVLCVLDGFGEYAAREENAVRMAETPVLDALAATYPRTLLAATGAAVGMPEDQAGSGEIGHMTLGAGRVVKSDRARIDDCLRARKIAFVPSVDMSTRLCMYDQCKVHLIGLLSDGGVHSHMDHLFSLIEHFAYNEIPIVIHAILDGCDTAQRSATGYLDQLQDFLSDKKGAVIGTVSGRYFAMDGDGRWDRTYSAYHAIVRDKQLGPKAEQADTAWDAVSLAYARGLSDDRVEPTRIGDYKGINGNYLCDFSASKPIWEWTGLEVGIICNFRPDRTRQLTGLLARKGVPDYVVQDILMDRHYPVLAFQEECLSSLTSMGDDIPMKVAFPKETVEGTLGQILAQRGLKQLRVAESEKTAHVTQFFNGRHEAPFDGEARKIVPSPKLVDTYDEKPEMAAAAVADAAIAGVEGGAHDFILVNFANADMLGHTGRLKPAIKAVQAIDLHLGRLAEAVKKAGGVLLVTSDHGNCEEMVDLKGEPHTSHTENPVPFLLVDERAKGSTLRAGGSLCDVAPTILDLLGIEVPEQMTGRSLRAPAS